MNSTDVGADGWADQEQFVAEFLVVAEKVLLEVGDLFSVGADPGASSYYRDRPKSRMARRDFEVDGLESPEALESALRRLWEGQGLANLASLAPRLADAARALHEVEVENDEVSPFIYVMF